MKNFFSYSITSVTIFILTTIILFVPILAVNNTDFTNSLINQDKEFITNTSSKIYSWPTPGYTTITCNFGYRKAPTSGASTYHGAIDIGAPPNSKIIACFSGKIIYTGFYGANGYTIILENSNDTSITATYSHLSPDYIVQIGEYVLKNQVIGYVGPKNVYNVANNPYKDSNGNPTNGATTGPHLHFAIKINEKAVNPLEYI